MDKETLISTKMGIKIKLKAIAKSEKRTMRAVLERLVIELYNKTFKDKK